MNSIFQEGTADPEHTMFTSKEQDIRVFQGGDSWRCKAAVQ